MKVTSLVRSNTPKKVSPAVYKTDRGTYLVQGYLAAEAYKAYVEDLAENEEVIEIPADLIKLLLEKLNS
ncbi:hypothetical protein MYX82_04315 [Acidobacteria bacterium AH-259-D05]|nr:hypothetical protein [Acidobacteria bacterium AH-259-D05]